MGKIPDKFNAVIESGEGIKSIADIINLRDNLDNYNLRNAGSKVPLDGKSCCRK